MIFLVLRNNLRIKNPGYKAPGGRKAYRINADVVIRGHENMLDDWTLKAVFSKRILNLQV